ncbi:MAG: sensory box histidine kinase/response regulator [Labilithrix sp.]|nr:sensory box histidine kinase/response regulator [Labilithrix sp.]
MHDPIFDGGGEAGALMRSLDWASTPLGPPATWSSTLRTIIRTMLASRFAMRVLWGPELALLHNDAYRPVLGADKYPHAMGRPTVESFAEVWPVVGPMFARVMDGETVALDNGSLPLVRHGYLEECYFTLSYSPLRDDEGTVRGVLGVVHETTAEVLAERRLETLRRLAGRVSAARTAVEVCRATTEVFAACVDVPFALLFLRGARGDGAEADPFELAASSGLDADQVPPGLRESASWPLHGDKGEASVHRVDDLRSRFGTTVTGAYPEPVETALVLPLARAGAAEVSGFLVVGVNPRRRLDPDFETFFELAREHVTAALANVRALAAVEAERTRLQALFLEAPAAIALLRGPDLVVELVNARYCAMVGATEAELRGRPLRAGLAWLAQDRRLTVEEVYRTGEPIEAREALGLEPRVPGGERAHLDWIAQPTRDEHGRVDGVMVFAMDVTAQVRARRVIEDSQRFLEGVVNQIPSGISIVEAPSGKTLLSNASAETIYGHPPIHTASVADFAAYHAVRADGQAVPVRDYPVVRALAGELVLEEEVLYDRPDGTRRILLVSASPVYDASGKRVAAVSAFVDITDRKRMEEALREARNVAESASRDKDEFLAIVSHELRNPLNAMLGWTRLLRGGTLSADRAARALETIERNATTQAQLIEDLLDVSRVIAGKLPLDVSTVTFARVVEAALESAAPAIEAKGLKLRVVLDTDATLSGDPARLQQVVWNLLTNATKFTPKGGAIQVTLRRDDSHVELAVTDSGQGIDPSFLEHVFDRFKQADPSTTKVHGGLGLGLSIAKNLVEMHGGVIEARSDGPGKGATFLVRLPVAAMRRSPAPTAPPTSRPPSSIVPLASPPEMQGLRVLVVDDEPDARDVMGAVLAGCGVAVRTAASVAEARAAFAVEVPDVLLSDIGMPVEDGYMLIKFVRSLGREDGGATPAACLTGYTTSEDRRRALLAGFNMHLAKPVEPSELIAVVANLGRMARALKAAP